jgi:hypothetical protein
MYDRDGASRGAAARTYGRGRDRLAQMERQRAELDEAIAELKDQMAWGAERARRSAAPPPNKDRIKGETDAQLYRPRQGHAVRAA